MNNYFSMATGCQDILDSLNTGRISSEVCRLRAGAALVATATEAATSTTVASLG